MAHTHATVFCLCSRVRVLQLQVMGPRRAARQCENACVLEIACASLVAAHKIPRAGRCATRASTQLRYGGRRFGEGSIAAKSCIQSELLQMVTLNLNMSTSNMYTNGRTNQKNNKNACTRAIRSTHVQLVHGCSSRLARR